MTAARVALICDFQEEHWPSMDLVGDMLFRYLSEGAGCSVVQVRPAMKRLFQRLPLFGSSRPAWNADRLLNRFHFYPALLGGSRQQFDLFHIVDHSYSQLIGALPPSRTVVHCHDLDTFRCLLDPQAEPRPPVFRAMARRILARFRQAAHVICVSATVRDQLLQYGLLPEARVSVALNGVHPACVPDAVPHADEALAGLLGAASNAPLLLHVGSTIERKRIDVLLRVFAGVARQRPDVRLARVGGPLNTSQAAMAKELGVHHAIVEMPFLDADVLAALYRRASILLVTSEAEGFGLPLAEAMACGCSVVASDIAVLREVGGAAAAYCGVGDSESWIRTAVSLLDEARTKSAAWAGRRDESRRRASRYSWAETARQTQAVYDRLLETPRHG